MKFLAFTDIHEDKKKLHKLVQRALQPDIDFMVCCGDISSFGRGLANVFKNFSATKKKMYVIPGNHEENSDIYSDALQKYPLCIDIHRRALKVGNYLFLGYGGGGFAKEDQAFRKIAREWYGKFKGQKIVLVTHGPPFATKIDFLNNTHVGNKDYRKFIERVAPRLVISGHLHETVGIVDKIGKTKVINPGWDGMAVELY